VIAAIEFGAKTIESERDDCQAERQIDGTHMMRSAVSGLPMSPGTLMMLGLELGSIESALATTLYPASLYAETSTDAMRCARYYDDFAVSQFYPYLKPDLLWPTSMM